MRGQSEPFWGYLVGLVDCAADNATSAGSRRGRTSRRTHSLPESRNALSVVTVEVETCERPIQVMNWVLPIKLATTRGQSSSRRVTVRRGVAVLPARSSREKLVGRRIKERPVTWSGRPSTRTRSRSRPNRGSFTAQGKVGWVFSDGGGETLVWSDSNRFLRGLAVVNVHPEVR